MYSYVLCDGYVHVCIFTTVLCEIYIYIYKLYINISHIMSCHCWQDDDRRVRYATQQFFLELGKNAHKKLAPHLKALAGSVVYMSVYFVCVFSVLMYYLCVDLHIYIYIIYYTVSTYYVHICKCIV